jgi:hydrogenase maturation protease
MKERRTPHLVHARPKILILALGNPLHGDDGIGVAIIHALTHITTLPSNVTLMDGGTGGIKIAQWIQDYQYVFIIDAADFENVPGEWRRFSIDDILCLSERKEPDLTLHNAGLTYALELASVLNTLPNRIVIYAIQPQNVDWSLDLSEPVQRLIPEICESIVKEIQDLHQVNDGILARKRRNVQDGQDFNYRR